MSLCEFTSQYRVAYADTDQMGFVYYGNYFTLFERSRTELLRSQGIAYSDLEAKGVGMPVLETQAHYHAPAHYDDLLDVTARIDRIEGPRVFTSYSVCRDGKLLCSGTTTLVFMNLQTGRAMRAPEWLVGHLLADASPEPNGTQPS